VRLLSRSISVLSLILCLATCALWIRSYSVDDAWWSGTWEYAGGGDYVTEGVLLLSTRGRLAAFWPHEDEFWHGKWQLPATYYPHPLARTVYHSADPIGWLCVAREWEFFHSNRGVPGFGWGTSSLGMQGFVIPTPALAVLFALPAVVWTLRRQWRSRQPDGYCEKCGYDLRGNPQSEICPECGAMQTQSPNHPIAR
jgi:hypothetical protein